MNYRMPWIISRRRKLIGSSLDCSITIFLFNFIYFKELGIYPDRLVTTSFAIFWILVSYVLGRYIKTEKISINSFLKAFLKIIFLYLLCNLILELMISYGLPVAFLITIIISTLFLVAFLKIFSIKNENNSNMIFEKAWIISLFILLISQMVDVQYFDGRLSIVFWILLAGARNIGRKI